MSLQSLRQRSWLRTAFAVLVLCFALGTVAHAGHRHDLKADHTQTVCDFCTSFSSLVDAPIQTANTCTVQVLADLIVATATGFIATRPVSVAQARAPPVSC